MRLVFLYSLCTLLAQQAAAQSFIQESGAYVRVAQGTTLAVPGNTHMKINTRFYNDGIVQSGGSVVHGWVIHGSGTWRIGHNLFHDGPIYGNATFVFTGAGPSTIASDVPLYNVWLEKSNSSALVDILYDLTISNELRFIGAGNKITLGTYNLSLSPNAQITNADATRYVVTNGDGFLIRNNMYNVQSRIFPVGADASSYNPVTLTNYATSNNNIGVRCLPHPLTNGTSGQAMPYYAVDAAWQIFQQYNSALLAISAQWSLTDELPFFNRFNCGLRWFNSVVYDQPATGLASGVNPFTRNRPPFSYAGVYIVASGYSAPTPLASGPLNRDAETVDTLLQSRLQIYPNPADQHVSIAYSSIEKAEWLQIIDAAGAVVLEIPAPAPLERIELLSFPAGLYRVLVQQPDGTVLRGSFLRLSF